MPEASRHNVPAPELTLPEEEEALLREHYAAAGVILEYGSGGSTVVAAEMPGKHVVSVESDKLWAKNMERYFLQNPPADGTDVEIAYVNIGPTAAWGKPANDEEWRKYPRYPLGVWSRDDFRHPDVVLVDGRFRIGCALATAFSITRPVTILFDDYVQRERTHQVEEFIGSPRIVGRMAEFNVEPMAVPADKLLLITRFMLHP